MKNKIITLWIQLRDLFLYIFRHAIIVNGYVDDHTWLGIRHRNWGDDLNYYMIGLLTGRPVIFYHNFRLAKWLHLKNYLCIGTLLDAVNYSNSNTIVWGSGVSGQERDFAHPAKICAVRGYKTRDFLISHGIDCPNVVGDSALLLPLYYQPFINNKEKDYIPKYKLGIIPHVIDQQHPVIEEIRRKRKDVLIIDLAHYGKWTDVIDQICSCDMIASSSLHGLIMSDAYGVPNCWIELTGKISGGYFKFFDYASSVARKLTEPFVLKSIEQLPQIVELCSEWKAPTIDTQAIMDACPFKIRKPIMH